MTSLKFSESQIVFREAVDSDYAYIKNCWIRACRSNPEFKYIKGPIYYPNQEPIINSILFNAKVFVASYHEDPTVIIGFMVYDVIANNYVIIDWINVKKTFRCMGIYDYMISKIQDENPAYDTFMFTHLPHDDHAYIAKREYKRIGLIYNPFLRNRYLSKDSKIIYTCFDRT